MTGFPLIIKDALVIAQVLLQDGAVIQLEEVYHDEIYKLEMVQRVSQFVGMEF